jgi:hypothetical protein
MRRAIYEVDAPTKPKPGEVLLQHGLAKQALPFLKKEFQEYDFRSWVNMGACLRTLGRLDEAKEHVKKAIELNQRCENAWYNLALLMEDYGEFEHAREAIEIAHKILPVEKEIAIHYATINMRLGNWEAVRDAFEFGREEFYWYSFKGIPIWRGELLDGKRLLVVHEGGYGDFFWLMRYFKLLKEQGCHVTYLAWKKQKEFAQKLCPWIDCVLAADEFLDTNDYDFQCGHWSLLSLWDGPLCMTEPYVVPAKLAIDKANFTVGISWQAEEMGMARKFRSIPMKDLAPLQNIPVNWTALNISKRIPTWCSDPREVLNRGWVDTASVIDRCDLVITIDTANAHLAGAMGKPTWLLLPKNSFWQWGTEEDSFVEQWYPSVRPFWNHDILRWDKLIEEVKLACGSLNIP